MHSTSFNSWPISPPPAKTPPPEKDAETRSSNSQCWTLFCNTVAKNKNAWVIREDLKGRSMQQFMEQKIKNPRFYKGTFKILDVNECYEQEFIMTKKSIPVGQIIEQVKNITGKSDTDDVRISFKGRPLVDSDNFDKDCAWHGWGGEIFQLTFSNPTNKGN